MFGREFQLLDLLILWDAIVAEGDHFELTNYIVVAMLMSIREEMLHSDYTTGLSYLMKYPSNIDVMSIIRHSLHMIAPNVSIFVDYENLSFLEKYLNVSLDT